MHYSLCKLLDSLHRDAAMADNQQEPVFSIDISHLIYLNQQELDELKYIDVPEEVFSTQLSSKVD